MSYAKTFLVVIFILIFFFVEVSFAQKSRNDLDFGEYLKDRYLESSKDEFSAKNATYNEFFDLSLFSLSKKIESSFDVPAAVYVVTSEDIRRSGAISIPEVLKMVPEIEVAQQGTGKWAIGSRGFNTQFTNNLLVLIDGRTVYTPLFAGTLWHNLDFVFEDIEKIEVIRGPGASIWGSNAVNGVINIITKNPEFTQGDYSSANISNRGDYSISARRGVKISDDSYFKIHAKHFKRESLSLVSGGMADDDNINNSAEFKYNKNEFSFQGGARYNDIGNYFYKYPSISAPFTEDRYKDSKTSGIHLLSNWEHEIDGNKGLFFQTYFDYDSIDTEPINRKAYTFDLDLNGSYNFDSHQLLGGIGYRSIVDRIKPDNNLVIYRKEKRHDKYISAFFQDKITIYDDSSYLTIGSKFEYNNFVGSNFQPRLSFEHFPNEDSTLWLAVTRAVRTQSRGEQDALIKFNGTPFGYISSHPDNSFQPEKLTAYEMGYRLRPDDKSQIEFSSFYNQHRDLRTLEPAVVPAGGNIFSYLATQNRAVADNYGVNVNGKYVFNSDFRIQGSYSFLKVDVDKILGSNDAVVNNVENQSPKNQFKLQSFYDFNEDWELDLLLNYVDNLSGTGSTGIDSYISDSMRLSYRPNENMELSLIGKNILESYHQEYGASLYAEETLVGRSIYFKIDYNF